MCDFVQLCMLMATSSGDLLTSYFKICIRLSKHYTDITIISTGVALNKRELFLPYFYFFVKEVIIYLSIACKATKSHGCLCVPARASGQEIANISCSLNSNQHCLIYTPGETYKNSCSLVETSVLRQWSKFFKAPVHQRDQVPFGIKLLR